MATVGYITNMDRSRSIRLHKQIVLIWDWALTRNNWISASHIPGKLNVEADKESRDNITRTEWMLSFYTFNSILNQLNFIPEVDLFASRINNKLPRFGSFRPDPVAEIINAFSISWSNISFYAFPPFICIDRVLQKNRFDKATGILVVPDWPNQPWYNRYMELVIKEVILPPRKDLLLLPTNSEMVHPLHKSLYLRAGLVSATVLSHQLLQSK